MIDRVSHHTSYTLEWRPVWNIRMAPLKWLAHCIHEVKMAISDCGNEHFGATETPGQSFRFAGRYIALEGREILLLIHADMFVGVVTSDV
jgi:hypothetical protein